MRAKRTEDEEASECGSSSSSAASEASSRESDSSHSSREVRRRDKHVVGRNSAKEDNIGQIKLLVMICVYFGPLSCGVTVGLCLKDLISSSSSTTVHPVHPVADGPFPGWCMHLLLAAAAISSLALALLARVVGRMRLLAAAAALHFVATVIVLFSSSEAAWMARLAEVVCGLAVGIHVPVQQLMIAETQTPRCRAPLSVLSYALLSCGILATALSSRGLADVRAVCVVNAVVLAVPCFVAAAFFHPETPRYYLVRGRRSASLEALRWLRRGSSEDSLEAEHAEMEKAVDAAGARQTDMPEIVAAVTRIRAREAIKQRSVWQPLLTSVTLLVMSSLSGAVSLAYLFVAGFVRTAFSASKKPDADLSTLAVAVSFVSPCATLILIGRCGRKLLLLVSSSSMAASALFLAMLAHFLRPDEMATFKQGDFGWTLPAAAVAGMVAFHMAMGPVAWLVAVEMLPAHLSAVGLALCSGLWFTFSLVFSLSLAALESAVGVTGICWSHAVVCALAYAFVLDRLPDIKRTDSLAKVQHRVMAK